MYDVVARPTVPHRISLEQKDCWSGINPWALPFTSVSRIHSVHVDNDLLFYIRGMPWNFKGKKLMILINKNGNPSKDRLSPAFIKNAGNNSTTGWLYVTKLLWTMTRNDQYQTKVPLWCSLLRSFLMNGHFRFIPIMNKEMGNAYIWLDFMHYASSDGEWPSLYLWLRSDGAGRWSLASKTKTWA
jgi:hypothetical protein